MKASQMVETKFLRKEDLDEENGNLVTIIKFDQQNVGMNEGDADMKWVVYYKEFQKGMVLNSTNIQLITKALGTDETDEWIGKRVVIFVDDNVSFGGKLVGGIRIRKVRGQAAKQAPAQQRSDQVQGHADKVLGTVTNKARSDFDELSEEEPSF